MSRNILILFFALIVLNPFSIPPLGAQEAADALSIEQALAAAWQNNPDVLEARRKIEIQRAHYRQTRKFPNPDVEFEVDKLRQDDDRALEGEGKVSQPLELWGKRGLKIGIAKDEVVLAAGIQKVWLTFPVNAVRSNAFGLKSVSWRKKI